MPNNADAMTVIVASYNHARFIAQCLNSVARQSDREFDLIVTDDASTDDSQQVIERTLADLGLTARTIFHTENRGLCATLNEALEMVETPLMTLISADDWLAPDRVRLHRQAFREGGEPVALVYGDMFYVDESGVLTGERFSDDFPAESGFGAHGRIFPKLFPVNIIPAPSASMRTECVRAVGSYDEALAYEDYDMWLRLARAYEVAFVAEPTVYYRQVDSSLSRQLWERQRILNESDLLMYEKHVGYSPEIDEILVPLMYRLATRAYRLGSDPARLRPALRRYARRHREPRSLLWALLAEMRVPGTVLRRINRKSQGLPGSPG